MLNHASESHKISANCNVMKGIEKKLVRQIRIFKKDFERSLDEISKLKATNQLKRFYLTTYFVFVVA